ncbi:MAG: prepilin-type N-terminal cleavage/methylation domain-containing protein [Bryobacterales bacterium]|jgi:type IV pilus assembly protein PilA|nr:prepilin-type N-terminal cleavage/methylation domain-containing protein [Bryobacterales bacterium]
MDGIERSGSQQLLATMARASRQRRRASRGFSLIELLIVIAIILIIVTIAVPRLGRMRSSAQEMAAIRHIQTIHTAQAGYFSQFGKYAESMQQLGPAASGKLGPDGADLLPEDLADGEKGGYKFQVAKGEVGYVVTAEPTEFGNTGNRTFFSDQTMLIRENYGPEMATIESSPIQ